MAVRLIFAVVLFLAGPLLADEQHRTVTVTGTGEVAAVPDVAFVTLGVSTRARTAREALSQNSAQMTEVFDVARSEGVEDADIQTSQITLQPAWERVNNNTRNRIVGYDAINTVTIRARDLDRFGGLLDALAVAGANRIQNIRFGIIDDSELMNDARRAAIADARARAELYATGAGATLGDVITINEFNTGGGRPMPMAMARADMAMEVPVAGGEVGLSVQVSATFALE